MLFYRGETQTIKKFNGLFFKVEDEEDNEKDDQKQRRI